MPQYSGRDFRPYNTLVYFVFRKIPCRRDAPNFDQNHVPLLNIKIDWYYVSPSDRSSFTYISSIGRSGKSYISKVISIWEVTHAQDSYCEPKLLIMILMLEKQ